MGVNGGSSRSISSDIQKYLNETRLSEVYVNNG
jgi:hypothetical protein